MIEKKITISLKIALMMFSIPFIGVSLGLALEYAADSVMMQKSSFFEGFLPVYLNFVLTNYLGLGFIFTLFFYLFTKKIETITNRLYFNQPVTELEMKSMKNRLRLLPILIVAMNVTAYFFGFLIYISAKEKTVYLFFYFFFPISGAVIYSILQIVYSNHVLRKTRELFHIHYLDPNSKERGRFNIRLKSTTIVTFIILYALSFIISYQIKAYNIERYNASLFEAVIKGEITIDRAEKAYRIPLDRTQVYDPYYTKVFTSSFDMYLLLYGLSLGLFVFVGVLIQAFFSLELTMQIKMQKERISDITEGGKDLTKRLNIIRYDEVGMLSDGINRFMDKILSIFLKFFQSSEDISAKSISLDHYIVDTFKSIESTLNGIIQISSNTKDQKSAAENTRNEIKKITSEIGKISSNVDDQVGFIEDTASAMNETAVSIQSINELTSKTAGLSSQLVSVANDGESMVDELIAAIGDIENASNMVMEMVEIIGEIATQSDVLAINAAIEAAHAGEAGKGFAVIAEEIRSFAESSSEHADQIGKHVRTMLELIARGVRMTDTAGSAFRKISNGILETSSLIEQISGATGEQYIGTKRVLESVTTVVDKSRQIKELIENLELQSRNINGLMDELITKAVDIDSTTTEQEGRYSKIKEIIEYIRNIFSENLKTILDLKENLHDFKM